MKVLLQRVPSLLQFLIHSKCFFCISLFCQRKLCYIFWNPLLLLWDVFPFALPLVAFLSGSGNVVSFFPSFLLLFVVVLFFFFFSRRGFWVVFFVLRNLASHPSSLGMILVDLRSKWGLSGDLRRSRQPLMAAPELYWRDNEEDRRRVSMTWLTMRPFSHYVATGVMIYG